MLLSRISFCLAILGCVQAIRPRQWKETEIPSEAYVEVQTDPQGVTWPWRVFKTSSETPPNMAITGNGGELAPGYIFMTPHSAERHRGTSAHERERRLHHDFGRRLGVRAQFDGRE